MAVSSVEVGGGLVNEQPQFSQLVTAGHSTPIVHAQGDSSVTIRNLMDTPEDAEFAGRLLVEAFRSKFVHATSEGSIPDCVRMIASNQRGQSPVFYQRRFVAEYDGKSAGIVAIKFNGDPKEREDDDIINSMGCCDIFGLWCMFFGPDEDVKPGKCYLDHIAVDWSFRGKGIGKILLERADLEAKRFNCNMIYLYVASDNRAINLYLRQGYVRSLTRWYCGFIWCSIGKCTVYKLKKNLA